MTTMVCPHTYRSIREVEQIHMCPPISARDATVSLSRTERSDKWILMKLLGLHFTDPEHAISVGTWKDYAGMHHLPSSALLRVSQTVPASPPRLK